ncbi:MAG: diguanylate cyclase (GGDEF)-like protein/PAS domain S-box-containing protein [Motiliproteus sp.]|jgi:diguanylate cyclase (GGDEF)-like protein/PAS domain S-box-containing protein
MTDLICSEGSIIPSRGVNVPHQALEPLSLMPSISCLNEPSRAALLLLLGVLFTGNIFAAPDTPSLDKITLQLRWLHQFQFAGYYAAKQQGYFRDVGMDVEIRAGAPGREPVQEVIAGRAQYGTANSELLYQRLRGAPLVALAAIFQHSASVLLVKQSSGISSPQDLTGRRVMLVSPEADVGLMAMFINEGVDTASIDIVKSSYDIQDLIEDRVDAFNAYVTNEPFFMTEHQIPVSLLQPNTYGVDFYSDILFTTAEELARNPERVKAFRQASLRGWKYAMDHPDEIIALILSQYSQAKSPKHLGYEARSMHALILPNLVELGHMNPGRWKHMAETFVKQGMVPPGYNLDGFIYDPDPKQNLRHWYILALSLLAGLLLIAAIALALLSYNRKLKDAIQQGQQSQEQLQQQTTLFEAIFRSTPDATVITNIQREIMLCNPAFSQTFGYLPGEMTTQSSALLYETEADFECQRKSHFTLNQTSLLQSYEINYRRKDGALFPSQSLGGPIINTRGETVGFIEVVRDISEQKRSQQEMIRLALTDPLTGLANRHQFNRRIEETLKLAQRQQQLLSLALMDLDYFKQVNDQFGHPTGDKLLQKAADILRENFRETDIIARIGGDEFAIIMIDPENATSICRPAELVIKALCDHLLIDSHKIKIGASFGIATYPLDSEHPEQLYQLADKALYRSKESGRNRCSVAHQSEIATATAAP